MMDQSLMDQAMTLKHLFQVQAEGKGSKHKMPINLSNEEEASKGKIEETINIAGFTVYGNRSRNIRPQRNVKRKIKRSQRSKGQII